MAKEQAVMEKQYLAVYKDNPIQAQAILQNFEDKTLIGRRTDTYPDGTDSEGYRKCLSF